MKDNFIHVCFIIDSSGSMWQSTDDVIGGFNRTITEQKDVKNGKCSVSLFKFNDTVEEVYVGKDVNEIDGIEYKAGGCTAMNDGIGTAITKIGEWLSNMEESERPSKNLIVIMTDGQENASKEYTFSSVKDMIKHQEEKYNWTFVYMGTDLTSMDDVNKLGIKMSAFSSRKSLSNNYNGVNEATTMYRNCDSVLSSQATMDWLSDATCRMSADYEKERGIKLGNN